MYSEKLLERFNNPKNVREMENSSAVGQVGNVKCGDIMKMFLKIENNIITDASVQTYGCVAAIAASDALCEIAKGKTVEEAEALTFKDVMALLGDVPQIKVHCSQLGIDALKKAVENYKSGILPEDSEYGYSNCPGCSRKNGGRK